jgi:hypothetical protein
MTYTKPMVSFVGKAGLVITHPISKAGSGLDGTVTNFSAQPAYDLDD